MPANPAVHPEPHVLQAFALGKQGDEETDSVARHLETCEGCREQLRGVPADSFLDKLKAAKPRDGATQLPRAAPSLAGDDTSLFASRPARAPNEPVQAPAELAGNSKFRLVRELGRGGMGVVYQAEHRTMER